MTANNIKWAVAFMLQQPIIIIVNFIREKTPDVPNYPALSF